MSSFDRLPCGVWLLLATLMPLEGRAAKPSFQKDSPAEISFGVSAYIASSPDPAGTTETVSYNVLANVSGAYAITPYWTVSGGLRAGAGHVSGTLMSVVHSIVEVRYVIERMSWRPWLAIGAGAMYRSFQLPNGFGSKHASEAVDVTLHVGAGLDIRIASRWSLGALVRYNVIVTERWGQTLGPFDITAQARFHF